MRAVRHRAGDRRYHGAAQERDVPDRRQAAEPGAREAGAAGARRHGVDLRQSYTRVGKFALIKHQRYAHAKQFKRANRALAHAQDLSRPRHPRHRPQDRGRGAAAGHLPPASPRWPGRVLRSAAAPARARRSTACMRRKSNASARARPIAPYEFGVKVSIATTLQRSKGGQFAIHAKALPGNPYDGHTLATVIPDMERPSATHHPHSRRCRLSRPQRAALPQVQGLHLRPEAPHDARRSSARCAAASAVEPVIGHIKDEHRMDRNYLAGTAGRRHQRRPRRRRLQLPPPPHLAEASSVPVCQPDPLPVTCRRQTSNRAKSDSSRGGSELILSLPW